MHLAMMTIGLINGFITAQPPDGVFDDDASPGKFRVVGDVRFRAGLTAWFPPGRRAQTVRMKLVDAEVSQVTDRADPLRQTVEQVGVRQYFDVSGRTRHTISHIDEQPVEFVDGYLALEGVLFLLAAVVFIGGLASLCR